MAFYTKPVFRNRAWYKMGVMLSPPVVLTLLAALISGCSGSRKCAATNTIAIPVVLDENEPKTQAAGGLPVRMDCEAQPAT